MRIYENKRHLTRKFSVPYLLGQMDLELGRIEYNKTEIENDKILSQKNKDKLLEQGMSMADEILIEYSNEIKKELGIDNSMIVIVERRSEDIIIAEIPHKNIDNKIYTAMYDKQKQSYYIEI